MNRYKEYTNKIWYLSNRITFNILSGKTNKYEKNQFFHIEFCIGGDVERPFIFEIEFTVFNRYIRTELVYWMYNRKRYMESKDENVYYHHPYLGKININDR